uniref:Uncharacterized protein n=1 Tax=Lactuca sativa TaxID=4236 RepID=A0A9R1X0N6_LACSA|nr:hypothetical protein LSAT_V11C700357400 [Lactuca sativa]
MHVPYGDTLLGHLMMLHEVRSQQVFEMGRVGPCVDLLYDEKGQSNSNIRARFIPRHFRCTFAAGRFRRLHYVSKLFDNDYVMLIQLVFMLKDLHGRDVKTGIPMAVYKLADNIDD